MAVEMGAGMRLRFSMVWYEMQRLELRRPGSRMARVGQASRHFWQLPHKFFWSGCVGARSRSVNMTARNTQEPNSLVIRQEFLPMKPRPACSA